MSQGNFHEFANELRAILQLENKILFYDIRGQVDCCGNLINNVPQAQGKAMGGCPVWGKNEPESIKVLMEFLNQNFRKSP